MDIPPCLAGVQGVPRRCEGSDGPCLGQFGLHLDGVFRTFRRRLTVEEAIAFAQVLPSVPRAMFVQDWDPTEAPIAFTARASLTREAQTLRPHHNLTPDNAIEATARAVWRAVDHRAFDRALDRLPHDARAFWTVDAPPDELAQRIR